MNKKVEVKVEGRTGIYTVTIDIIENVLNTTCTCRAGEYNQICWHVVSIINGNRSIVVSNNEGLDDVYSILKDCIIPGEVLEKINNGKMLRNRTMFPVVNFEDGFAKECEMAVPDCFRSAFDIVWMNVTIEKKNKKKGIEGQKIEGWTQGERYSFSDGDTIYSDKIFYSDWPKVFPDEAFALQVISSIPCEVDEDYRIKSNGIIVFDVLVVKNSKAGFEKYCRVKVSQVEFIDILRFCNKVSQIIEKYEIIKA